MGNFPFHLANGNEYLLDGIFPYNFINFRIFVVVAFDKYDISAFYLLILRRTNAENKLKLMNCVQFNQPVWFETKYIYVIYISVCIYMYMVSKL